MKVLVIGSGGREHALCWKLAQRSDPIDLFAIPGNPGIASVATCIPGAAYLAAAESVNADLTIVGPEAPLAAGVVDQFRAAKRAIVGPTAAAARLESSKVFAKEFMQRARIPTGRAVGVEGADQAREALRQFQFPVVLKADGLAAGKGVIVVHTTAEAAAAAERLLGISPRLVIEEFLAGEEVSFIVLSDGEEALALEPAQDHKAVFDDDQGPNTGGMGAYCDSRILSESQRDEIMNTIIRPALDWMRSEGTPFAGFLYAGLMLTAQGPRVLEFNVRLGDPETQAVLYRLACDPLPALMAAARGGLHQTQLSWREAPSVCVVMSAHGYPGEVRTDDPIAGIEKLERGVAFQASTKLIKNRLVTAGGRVLGVTSCGPDLGQAIANTYREVDKIQFAGMHYRKDIGRKGLRRW